MVWENIRYFVEQATDRSIGEVVPNRLYIGSEYFRLADMEDRNIRGILNLSDTSDPPERIADASYLWNWEDDDGKQKPPEYWEKSLIFASQILGRDDALFVHCHAGVHRSAATTYLILRAFYSLPPEEAWTRLEAARPAARPRYMSQVDEFLKGRK